MRSFILLSLFTGWMSPCGGELGVDTAAASPRATAAPDWTLQLGGDQNDTVTELVLAPDGAVVIAGQFEGELVIGSDTLLSAGETDAYVAVIDPDGEPRWAERVGGPGFDAAGGLAVGAAGEVILVGDFAETIHIGAQTFTALGDSDVFTAAFAADGAPRWSAAFAGRGWQMVSAAAAWPAGGAAIVFTSGDLEREGDAVRAASADAIVALVDRAGALRWTRRLKGSPWAQPHDVAVTPDGDVVVAGSFIDRLRLPLRPALRAEGAGDGFVARYSARGELEWVRQISRFGEEAVTALAVGADEIWFAGNAVDPDRVSGPSMARNPYLLFGRVDGTGDDLELAERGTAPTTARSLQLLPGGAVLIAGTAPPSLGSSGSSELVVAMAERTGSLRELLRVSGSLVTSAPAVLATDGNTLVVGGSFVRRARTKTQRLEGRGGFDGFVLTRPIH